MLLPSAAEPVAIIGAGPAGLTAAYELARRGAPAVVLEADDVVGGLSRTAVRNGWRFDIGGHRFFTKVAAVEALWHELLPGDDFLLRPRKSRIYYRGRFFDYPLRPVNALLNLGPLEALLCLLSYLSVRLRPPRDQSSFEGWTAARFGWRLYRIFFKSYTEKVWGAPCTAIQADWAAQRIKNLSLGSALWSALVPSARGNSITSLIEEFRYPKFGPGMMWERCHERVEAAGVPVHLHSPVVRVCHEAGRARAVVFARQGGEERLPVSQVISSMPIGQLLRAMDPPPPATVLEAAARLKYRDFVVVALVVPKSCAFPDNWIYIHAPEVRLGRVQNFGAWSPHMVHSGRTCLGLEYFVHADDELWTMPDAELIELAKREIASIGLLDPAAVEEGYVVRMPKAYPVYDSEYQRHVATLREWLAVFAPNVQTVGRNGMHRYNNQDHSMYTAMLAVENIFGTSHDLWRVNVEEAYLEEVALDGDGSGRAAPVLPG